MHVDAVQGFGKYHIYPKREGIDLLSLSSHKIHESKGMGALYIREGVKIRPIVFGGELTEECPFRDGKCAGNRRTRCGSEEDLQ